jgi:acyl carrier protein
MKKGEAFMESILKSYLREKFPDYMIPAQFVQMDEIPLTPGGKVNWQLLPEPGKVTASTDDYLPARDEIEEKLVKIWSEVLSIEKETIGIDDDFFELGGHSLKITKLSSIVHKQMNVRMPLDLLFEYSTIRKLAEHIKKTREDLYIPLVKAEEMEYYPVSSAQKRMFLLNQLKNRDISDNSPGAMILEGRVDKRHIEEVFKKLIKRHEILRTSFELEDMHPVQVVHKDVEFEIEYYDMKEVEVEEERSSDLEGTRGLAPLPKESAAAISNLPLAESTIKNFIRPFDLSKAPLLRVGLIKLPHTPAPLRGHPRRGTYNSQEGKEPQNILLVDMHHIIIDDTSAAVFLRDFIDLYNGKELPEPRIQYKDFACWQNELLQSERVKKQEEYWVSVFSGKIPLLDLPTDFPRPLVQSFEGCFIRYTLPHDLTVQLNRMAKENNVTLYMLLLAIYTILLGRYSGQEDIVVGTPIAGRVHPDLENIMGFFVNTLAMRNFPKGEKIFIEFLEEVKSDALKAFENQDYQFDQLVDRLGIQQDAGRQKMFDTMLVVQNVDIPLEDLLAEIKDITFKPYEFRKQATQFDILLHAFESDTRIHFRLDYCTKLFKEETMVRFMDHLQNIAREVTADPYKKISAIKIFSDDEQAELIARSSKEKLSQVEMKVDFDF